MKREYVSWIIAKLVCIHTQSLRLPIYFVQQSVVQRNPRPLLPAATKLGQGNIFTSVCQEFCPQGGRVSPSVHAGIPPRTRHPPWDQAHHPPQTRHPPRTRHPPGADPPETRHTHTPSPGDQAHTHTPGKQTAAYGQRAAGTHPTGMHSCLSHGFNSYMKIHDECYIFRSEC